MAVIVLGDQNDFEKILGEGLAVVDFYADWCGPCKMFAPVLEEVSNEEPSVTFLKVNVDTFPDLAQKFNIMSIPTVGLFKAGKLLDQKMGYMAKDQVKALINSGK